MSFKFPNLTNMIVRKFSNSMINLKKNHYDCLEITPKATQGDIKSAYYKLSKQYHPDLNKDNESAAGMFRDITEAYEVLGNVRSRKLYDRGVSVRGNDDFDMTEEPVRDDIKHGSFYRHWNKPASRKKSTGKTTLYDIDEWTKAHYSDTFNKTFSRKKSDVEYMKDKSHTRQENVTHLVIVGTIFILIGFSILFQSSSPQDKFDGNRVNTNANVKNTPD